MALVGQRKGLFIVIVLLLKSVFSLLSNLIFICCSVDVHNWRHGGFKASVLASESRGLGSRLYPQCTNHIRWSTFSFFASVSKQCPSEKRLTKYLLCHPMLFHPLFLCLNFSRLLRSLTPDRTNSQAHAVTIPDKTLGTPCNIYPGIYQFVPFPQFNVVHRVEVVIACVAKLFWCTFQVCQGLLSWIVDLKRSKLMAQFIGSQRRAITINTIVN